jgi:hypothetical protein
LGKIIAMSSAAAVDKKMSMVDELDRLAELREREHLSPAEYERLSNRCCWPRGGPCGRPPHPTVRTCSTVSSRHG